MLTRRKRTGIDSSPKYTIARNIHLLSKETISDTVSLLSTPTRPNRYKSTSPNFNNLNDDSPILSQEYSKVTWRWGESTPIRSKPKTPKTRQSAVSALQNRHSYSDSDTEPLPVPGTSAALSPTHIIEPDRQSPKGLYKFQEEMRKIQQDASVDANECDNASGAKASVTEDTGYPKRTNNKQPGRTSHSDTIQHGLTTNKNKNHNNNNNNNNSKSNNNNNAAPLDSTPSKPPRANQINDSLTKDLLNDSDFDQVLLTCSERIESAVNATQQQQQQQQQRQSQDQEQAQPSTSRSATQPTSVASQSSANGKGSSTTSSELNLLDDESIDDLLCNIDVDIPFNNDTINTAKFARHKSMPQEQQKAATAVIVRPETNKQPSTRFKMNASRKSFTRHESMPATNTLQKQTHVPGKVQVASSGVSGAAQKCTSEEIAEKRRQAIERLKRRNQQNSSSTKKN